jgi:hypothetical protein
MTDMREETLLEKVTIAIIFTVFVVLMCMLPDFGREPCDIDASEYVKRICREAKAK